MLRVQLIALLLPCFLLCACGGDTSKTAPKSNADISAPPSPPNNSVIISGEDHIAPALEHRLYASTESTELSSGKWTWSVDEGESLLQNLQVDGHVLRFTPLATDATHRLRFSVIYTKDADRLGASKSIFLHPADDETMAPLVSAGDPLTADEASAITLQGRAQAQGGRSIRRLQWQQISGPQAQIIGANDQDQLSLLLPQVRVADEMQFRLTASDSGGFHSEARTVVFIRNSLANQLPEVNAGPAKQAMGRERVHLTGEAIDPDGNIVGVQWRILAPFEHIAIENADQFQASFIAPNVAEATELTLRLRASDDENGYSEADTVITILPGANTAPTITVFSVDPGVAYNDEIVHLYADANDADGDDLRFSWQILHDGASAAIALRNEHTPEASFTVPQLDNAYNAEVVLDVSDGRAISRQTYNVQLLSRQQSQPDAVSCLIAPLQQGCPLYPVAALLNAKDFTSCSNPLDESCLLGDLIGPALRQCLNENDPSDCRDGLQQLYDPSYVLEQLGTEHPADACTPAYDEQSFEHYIGALHEHTGYSDGVPMTKPADVFREVRNKGYDFAAASDHSDTLQIPLSVGLDRAECPPEKFLYCVFLVDEIRPQDALAKWAATLSQTTAASTTEFTAIRGFEWTSDRFGHANVFFSRNFINAKTGMGYAVSMLDFWQWFSYPAAFGGGNDGLLSFNHPGREDAIESVFESLGGDPAYTFNDFRYVPAADYRTIGLEVFGKGSEYDSDGPNGSWLAHALDKGWHLAPISSEDHHGLAWGDKSLPKTVLISRSRSLDDLREAMLARRAYALAQNYDDVRARFYIDNKPMGSRLRRSSGTAMPIHAEVLRAGQTMTTALIQLVGPGNEVVAESRGGILQTEVTAPDTKTYLFLRIMDTAAQNRPIVFTAPIWIMPGEDALPPCLPPEIWRGDSVFYPAVP
tara:strand:+ start:302 stop:3091 length:2790 start_codon:yes stop_codon:yes gene_type:complete